MPIDVVVADDLTGAADTLVQFVPVSERTIVYPSLEQFERAVDAGELSPDGGSLALAVSTESRHLPPAEAGARVVRAQRAALRLDPRLLFQKVDSALRGNPGAELEAYARATGARLLLMTPAFPPSRRTVRKGVLLVNGLPIDGTADGADPRTPLPTASVPLLLGMQTDLPVATVTELPGTIDGRSDGITVVDAETDADLDRIAGFALSAGLEHAVSGSAGFAAALARRLPLATRTAAPLAATRRVGVLIVCGSPHATIAAQIAWLVEATGAPLRRIAIEDVAPAAVERDRTVSDLDQFGLALLGAPLLVTANGSNRCEPAALLARLASLAREVVAVADVGALVLSGGDTAAAVCQALGVDHVELLTQVFQGAPVGRIAGGIAEGVALATKSGAHGDHDGLVRIVEALHPPIVAGRSATT